MKFSLVSRFIYLPRMSLPEVSDARAPPPEMAPALVDKIFEMPFARVPVETKKNNSTQML